MKARGKSTILLLAGVLVGLSIGPAAQAVSEYIQAQQSPCAVYVDGDKVELDAYLIHENNYVQLRDIGKAVGFNVYWDGANVQIESGKPYTGEPPAPATETDYSQQTNPAVFTAELTRAVYNAVRESVVNKDSILAGTSSKVKLPSGIDTTQVSNLLAKISIQPVYELNTDGNGGYVCYIHTSDANERAKESVTPFLNSIEGMSDREKVTQMVYYVADHLTYAVKYPYPDKVFGQDGQVEGCCMAYAYSFKTLCDLADIPCVFVHSEEHQWNKVYVDGQWWDVDVSSLDAGDETRQRSYATVLYEASEMQGADFVDASPEITAFAKELLVPGSIK